MTPALGETVYLDLVTSDATGAAADADSTPTAEVFENAVDTTVVALTCTKRTSKTGNYRVPVVCTAANGFEDGKSYNVIASATVGGIAAKATIGRFQVRAARVGDTPALLTGTCPAASTASTLRLPTSAPDVDNLYNGALVVITGGTGIGQDARKVVSYAGASGTPTFTCVVTPDWVITPDTTTTFVLIPCGRVDVGLVKGGITPNPTVTGQMLVNVNEWKGSVVPTPSQNGVPKVDVAYSLGVAVLNEDFTLASATSTTITLPTTASSGAGIPDDVRYEYTVLQVVGGTGVGQVILTTSKSGVRTFGVFGTTMPVQPDNTSKIAVIGAWGNTAVIAANTITAASIAADAITAAKIADGAIDTATFAGGTTIPRVTLADTVTAYTGNTPQTGDAYARIGATGTGLTSLALASQIPANFTIATFASAGVFSVNALANAPTGSGGGSGGASLVQIQNELDARNVTTAFINAAINSRQATFTNSTGVTLPATVASPTNITAGTITTVTTLSSLPSVPANWLTLAGIAADSGLRPVRSGTAQAGGSNTLTLDSGASSTLNFYYGSRLYLTGGTGVGQCSFITAYNGSTKVATVSPQWNPPPDNTTTFSVLPRTSVFNVEGAVIGDVQGSVMGNVFGTVNGVNGNLIGNLSGKVLGGGTTTITGIGAFAVDSTGALLATAVTAASIKAKTDSLTFTTPGKVDAKLTGDGLDNISVTDPGVVANWTTLPRLIVAMCRRVMGLGKTVKDNNSGTIKTYADNGTTVNSTSTFTSSGGVDTVNKVG